MYGRHRITDGRYTDTKAKQLAGFALQKLSEQASLHAMDPVAWGESYISMAQLRDDILRDEFSASRRTKLWEKVQKKVESNSNVRPMVREGRTGDVGRVWEWIGAIGAIDKTPHSDRRKRSSWSLVVWRRRMRTGLWASGRRSRRITKLMSFDVLSSIALSVLLAL
jgi:hypothetical protein